MTDILKLSAVTQRHVAEALAPHGLPIYEFMTWKSHLEYMLEQSPDDYLTNVKTKTGWIYQRVENKIVGGRNFTVTWEIEKFDGQFRLLDLSVIAMPPDLLSR